MGGLSAPAVLGVLEGCRAAENAAWKPQFLNEGQAKLVAEGVAGPQARTLQRPFILMTKELALLGFFTSRVGATQVLQYVATPGSYQACVPLAQAGNGKTWAVEPGGRF